MAIRSVEEEMERISLVSAPIRSTAWLSWIARLSMAIISSVLARTASISSRAEASIFSARSRISTE